MHGGLRLLIPVLLLGLSIALPACSNSDNPKHTPHQENGHTSTRTLGPADAYLAYVDAASHFDPADESTMEDLWRRSTGKQHDADVDFYRGLVRDGWRTEGVYAVVLADVAESTTENARLNVCLDVTGIHFIDQTGAERVPPGSAEKVQAIEVEMKRAPSSDAGWLVAHTYRRDGEPMCNA